MTAGSIGVVVDDELRFFLPAPERRRPLHVAPDAESTVGHLVESLGIPLTEVGGLTMNGTAVPAGHRAGEAGRLVVTPVHRPQQLPTEPARFLLDVHLGSLARRLRLLGLDVSYRNDADDDELVEQAVEEQRVLLTQDRGLLRRRALPVGAYVRGRSADEQSDDVLDRFAPTLAPWTRCGACGGLLEGVARQEVEQQLQPGTRRTYDTFSRCTRCGRPYWRGAHAHRLDAAVRRAQDVVAARRRHAT